MTTTVIYFTRHHVHTRVILELQLLIAIVIVESFLQPFECLTTQRNISGGKIKINGTCSNITVNNLMLQKTFIQLLLRRHIMF